MILKIFICWKIIKQEHHIPWQRVTGCWANCLENYSQYCMVDRWFRHCPSWSHLMGFAPFSLLWSWAWLVTCTEWTEHSPDDGMCVLTLTHTKTMAPSLSHTLLALEEHGTMLWAVCAMSPRTWGLISNKKPWSPMTERNLILPIKVESSLAETHMRPQPS